MEDGRSIRTVTKIGSLIDVGPVTFPAYPDADVRVAQRSFDAFRQQRSWQWAVTVELRRRLPELRAWMKLHGR